MERKMASLIVVLLNTHLHKKTLGAATFGSRIFISGNSILQNSLNVTSTSVFSNNISLCWTLTVSGMTTFANNTTMNEKATCIPSFNVSGITNNGMNDVAYTGSGFSSA